MVAVSICAVTGAARQQKKRRESIHVRALFDRLFVGVPAELNGSGKRLLVQKKRTSADKSVAHLRYC